MSPLTEPTKLTLAKTYVGIDDPDAANYIALVEAADTAAGSPGGLETATKVAIHSFVKGCKADGIWPAIKASCILAGARTLSGALVPLVGTAPTNVGGLFVQADYNRKTGLKSNGSNKYLSSNRSNDADPQNSKHASVFISSPNTLSGGRGYIGTSWDESGGTVIGRTNFSSFYSQCNSSGSIYYGNQSVLGFAAVGRSSSSSFIARSSGINTSSNAASQTPSSRTIDIFRVRQNSEITDASLTFYSIGESLDLAKLDARVTDLIIAFGAAIP